jgi:hypothetical protein
LEVEGTWKSLKVDGRMMFAGKKYMFSRYGTGRRQQERQKSLEEGDRGSHSRKMGQNAIEKKRDFSTSDCHMTEINTNDCHVHSYRETSLKNEMNATSGFQESKKQ